MKLLILLFTLFSVCYSEPKFVWQRCYLQYNKAFAGGHYGHAYCREWACDHHYSNCGDWYCERRWYWSRDWCNYDDLAANLVSYEGQGEGYGSTDLLMSFGFGATLGLLAAYIKKDRKEC